jgi:peroxiredoxin
MPERDRGRRLRFIAISVAVAAIIWSFTPKGASGPMKEPGSRRAMPAFSLPALGGGEWSLADQRGKVLLVNFWATWCPPCRRETPELVELHKQYAGRGFSVVGISLDERPEQVVPAFVEKYRMPYPVLTPTADFDLASRIESLPTSFLVDREGRIARTYLGAVTMEALTEDVEALLK